MTDPTTRTAEELTHALNGALEGFWRGVAHRDTKTMREAAEIFARRAEEAADLIDRHNQEDGRG